MSSSSTLYTELKKGKKFLAILIDPDKFLLQEAFINSYLTKIPSNTTHLFIGGSTDPNQKITAVVTALKAVTKIPIVLFPGDYKQITPEADALLFLSLLSGNNPEYLIGQQTKAAQIVQKSGLEVIPTGYLLINGGVKTAVERVSKTMPLAQDNVEEIVSRALAGQYLGKQLIYLEAGSGARTVVHPKIISAVCDAIYIPVIVGGGIRSQKQLQAAYDAGATLVVIGTAYENDSWEEH